MKNKNLNNARKAKCDEFYTLYEDIEKEVNVYYEHDINVFRNKTIYCNCDEPTKSNFIKYFIFNFNKFKLKTLIATCYSKNGNGKKLIINEVNEVPESLDTSLIDVINQILKNKKNELTTLNGNGDFRSPECIEILKQSDIIVTNPPYSLFRYFFKLLIEHNKKFLVLGNMNAITYKDVFYLIKNNIVWLGHSIRSGDREFLVPSEYPLNAAVYRVDKSGKKYIRVSRIRWFTNLQHGKQPKPLKLKSMNENLKHNKKIQNNNNSYKKYDNYDAIEVPYTDAIPNDYDGIMGLPVSFLDKYNSYQFEILGTSTFKEYYNGVMYGKPVFINGKELYKRIFIKHKNPQKP
jgi:hypothetical protein